MLTLEEFVAEASCRMCLPLSLDDAGADLSELGVDSLGFAALLLMLRELGVVAPAGVLRELRSARDLFQLYELRHQQEMLNETPEPSGGPSGLNGTLVSLRELRRSDEAFLYALATNPSVVVRWRFNGVPPTQDQFSATLWHEVARQFVVIDSITAAPVGHVVAYQHHIAGNVKVAVVVEPDAQMSGVAFEAVVMFIEHVFKTLNVRQIYADVIKPNLAQFASGVGTWFEVCGVLREQLFIAGRYEDLVIVRVTRDAWCGNESLHRLLHGGHSPARVMEDRRG